MKIFSKLIFLCLFCMTTAQVSAQSIWADTINQRLEYWLFGPQSPACDSLLKARQNYFQESVKSAHALMGQLDYSNHTPYNLDSNKQEQQELRDIFAKILFQLTFSYRIKEWPDGPNEDYQSQTLSDSLCMLYNYFNIRGWNENANQYVVRDTSQFSYLGFLPVGGTMGNNYGGYAISIWLFKDQLKAHGIYEREMNTLNQATFFLQPSYYGPGFDFPGFNSDGLKSFSCNRLWYILSLDDPLAFEEDLNFLVYFINKALGLTPGLADIIKPDYMGFHHKHVYQNAYASEAYRVAAIAAWLLRDTPYSIQQERLENLRQALLASRNIAQRFDIAPSISGRFPFNLDNLKHNITSFILLADCLPEYRAELLSAAKRLIMDADTMLLDVFIENVRIKSSISSGYYNMVALECLAKDKEVIAEPVPSGHWSYPYGGLTIHRREHWILSFKGQSRYIVDFEGNKNQNAYGKNLSAGSLYLYTNGQPINAASSGYLSSGYNWNFIPGSTALYYDSTDFPKGKLPVHLSHTAYNGSVVYEDQGTSALIYEDINSSLRARKSVYYLDNFVLCLGSDIEARKDERMMVSTLFQNGLAAPIKETSNLKDQGIIPKRTHHKENTIIGDSFGNHFILFGEQNLKESEGLQIFPTSTNLSLDTGYFHTAYLDHGISSPQGQSASYTYGILIQDSNNQAMHIASQPQDYFQILRQDSLVHAVYFPQQQMLMANFFYSDSLKAFERTFYPTEPCLMIIKRNGNMLKLAIQNPDFGWWDRYIPSDTLYNDPNYLYAESPVQEWELFVSGDCHTVSDHRSMAKGLSLELLTRDARTFLYEIECNDLGIGETPRVPSLEDLLKMTPMWIYDIQGRLIGQYDCSNGLPGVLTAGVYCLRPVDKKYEQILFKMSK